MPSGYFFNPEVPGFKPLLGKAVPKLERSPHADGGIVSSLADMTTWDRALYQGAELPQAQQRQLESLVSEKTGKPIPRTTLSDPAGFGLGVAQLTSPVAGTLWGYEGTTFGYRVQHLYLPHSRVIIALAANSTPANDEMDLLGLKVYQTLQKAGALASG